MSSSLDSVCKYVVVLMRKNYTSNLQVRLKAKPLRDGVLKVIGVRWLLAGVVTGHRDFAIHGPQISKSKSGARSIPPPNKRLKFHILTVSSCIL